ncbi:MAG: hydrogenase maturation protease [Phycisphaerae bacterium]|nr:hydrogenase maturation protease [Phycisphaerae bacterium]
MNMKPIIVVGLGNPLMADEGIGVVLVEELSKLAAAGKLPTAGVEYYDGGCGGMYLLHTIADRKKAVLIDCCLMGTEPGTIRRFTPDDVASVKQMAHLSLHEVDILKVIELAKEIGSCPDEIVIFGIEPVAITQQLHLNEPLQSKIPDYIAAIETELLLTDNR